MGTEVRVRCAENAATPAAVGHGVTEMPEGDVETYYVDGKWRNRIEGNPGFLDEFGSREEAVLVGRDHARELQVEHIVHNQDGTIGQRSSYGQDPRSIPG